ncbi:MAG: SusC/RagA family TonB-linked outer membrane protein [Saprospiraceae bacterium]
MKLNIDLKSLILIVSLFLFGTTAYAQRTISGKISDKENGEALIGANVKVSGTGTGAVSDLDGNYSLQVPAGATQLEFSYTGYSAQTVTIGVSNVIDITLVAGTALEEFVTIGYGTQKRKDLTGSITSITSENFVKGAVQSPEQLISGKVAGIQVVSNGGRPGEGSTIRIRGGSSLNANNEPLIVIDGVPIESALKPDGSSNVNGAANPLSMFNPADIESVTVLKDASATAIYGSRAANGVIMIVTKKGQGGKPVFNVSTLVSAANLTKKVDIFTGDEYRELVNAKGTASQKLLLGKENTDWQDAIYRTAISHDNNFSVSGSLNNQLPYRLSYNLLNQNGILKNSSMLRNGGSVNLSPKLFNNSLKVDVNYKVAHVANKFADKGAISNAVNFDPTQPIYDVENSAMGGYFEWRKGNIPNNLSPRNPVALLDLKKDDSKVLRQIGNIQLDYAIPFVKGLRANLNVGLDLTNSKGDKATPVVSAAGINQGGYVGEYWQNKVNKLMEFYLNYNKTIGPGRLDLTAGHSYQSFDNKSRGYDKDLSPEIIRRTFPDTSTNVLVSFFSRAIYNINEKYIFTGTYRADASSRFSPEKRWGNFLSGAFAWRIGEEKFIKNMNLFSDLKLRVGYGTTGQQDVNCVYCYLANYTESETTASYQFGDKFTKTLRPEAYDQDLKWESTATTNLALDYGFLNGKIFGSIDFYERKTSNLLGEIAVPAGSNLKNRIITNVGSLTNKGVEFVLNLNAINTDKTNWTVGFNITRNINEINSLSKLVDSRATGIEVGGIAGGVGNNIQINVVGNPRNTFLVYKQVYDTKGNPIEGVFADLNNDGKIDVDDRYYYNSPNAKYFLGISSQFSYDKFNCGFTMRGNVGNYMYNNVFSNRGVYDQISTADGFLSNVHRNAEVTNFKNISPVNTKSDYYVENASFLRMDNFFLGYNVGKLGNSKVNLALNFNIQNAFVITKYRGLDPEVFSGIDNDLYPRARTFALGVNLGF